MDGDGRPAEALVGRFTEDDVPGILEAAPKHRVPLRHTYVISLLARRDAVLAEGPPDPATFGRYAGSEWTARLFRRQPGMLVPHSTVRAPALRAGHPLHALRMSRTGVWGKGETLVSCTVALSGTDEKAQGSLSPEQREWIRAAAGRATRSATRRGGATSGSATSSALCAPALAVPGIPVAIAALVAGVSGMDSSETPTDYYGRNGDGPQPYWSTPAVGVIASGRRYVLQAVVTSVE